MALRIDMSPSPAALEKEYGAFSDKLKDFRVVWKDLSRVILEEVNKIFATQGAPLAGYFPNARIPWERLTTNYARFRHFRRGRKRRNKREGGMAGPVNLIARNTLTGKLFAKLTAPSAARLRPMSMSYGVYSLAYARSVQFGHPARPFIGRTNRIMGAANSLLHRRIDQIIDEMSRSLGPGKVRLAGGG
jgi:hypothetical protein